MSEAVGMIQILGFPGTLAAADAMLKAARVTLVEFDKGERGQFYIVVRGPNSEVQRAMPVGLQTVEEVPGAELINHFIIPNPSENVVDVLKLGFGPEVQQFR